VIAQLVLVLLESVELLDDGRRHDQRVVLAERQHLVEMVDPGVGIHHQEGRESDLFGDLGRDDHARSRSRVEALPGPFKRLWPFPLFAGTGFAHRM
jgi:hypothetical protein